MYKPNQKNSKTLSINHYSYLIKTIVLLLCFLHVHLYKANGQQKFKQGYIVTTKGDTITGEISFPSSYQTSKTVYFKQNDKMQKSIYTPNMIRSFLIGNTYYVSAIVEKEVSPTIASELDNYPAIQLQNDTVFLEQLIER